MTATIATQNICDLLDIIFPNYWAKSLYREIDYAQSSKAILKWCDDNNYHYYARSRENFSESEAITEAEKLGKVGVVMEDMS